MINGVVPLLESALAKPPQIAKMVLEKVLGKLNMGALLDKVIVSFLTLACSSVVCFLTMCAVSRVLTGAQAGWETYQAP